MMKRTLIRATHTLFKPVEEHMLANTIAYSALLNQTDLSGMTVVEFGAGNGVLTELILSRNPERVIAYELNQYLAKQLSERCRHDPRLQIEIGDFTLANFDYLNKTKCSIISNPPYSTIPFLHESIISRFNIQDVIMMTSPKKQALYFKEYEAKLVLQGDDFSPPATGEHIVVQKGFESLVKNTSSTLGEAPSI